MLPDDFSLEVIDLDGFTVMSLAGELDSSTVPALKSALEEACASRIVVDLSSLDFMDSSGISALVEAHHRSRVGGAAVVVVVRPESVPWRVIELTNLAQLVPIAESLSKALRNEIRIATANPAESLGDVDLV